YPVHLSEYQEGRTTNTRTQRSSIAAEDARSTSPMRRAATMPPIRARWSGLGSRTRSTSVGGKDRPVLVLAEEAASRGGPDGSGRVLVALMMTTRDRAENGEVHTDQHGSTWVDIGTGEIGRASCRERVG